MRSVVSASVSSKRMSLNGGGEDAVTSYVKLPPLSQFDGTFEEWLEIKETFMARNDSRSNLPVVGKFNY